MYPKSYFSGERCLFLEFLNRWWLCVRELLCLCYSLLEASTFKKELTSWIFNYPFKSPLAEFFVCLASEVGFRIDFCSQTFPSCRILICRCLPVLTVKEVANFMLFSVRCGCLSTGYCVDGNKSLRKFRFCMIYIPYGFFFYLFFILFITSYFLYSEKKMICSELYC